MLQRILVFSALCLLLAMPAQGNLGPKEIELPSSEGAVAFRHLAHQEREPNCRTCHHRGIKRGRCSYCHGVWIQAPAPKKAFHTLCLSCHQEASGPTTCAGCHQR